MSKNLEIYGNYTAKDTPAETLKLLIREFILDAAIDMGNKPDDNLHERVYYFISSNFSDLTILQIGSAFKRGALGQFGPGKLVSRTIYQWLATSKGELSWKTGAVEKISSDRGYMELGDFPLGKAICKKIDWYRSGMINSRDWDNIPLKELAGIIGSGRTPVLADFGIISKL